MKPPGRHEAAFVEALGAIRAEYERVLAENMALQPNMLGPQTQQVCCFWGSVLPDHSGNLSGTSGVETQCPWRNERHSETRDNTGW